MAHAPAHHHDHEHHEDTTYGDPTGSSTAYVALVGVLIFVLVIIYLQALYYTSEQAQWQEKVVNQPSGAFNLLQEAQAGYLSGTNYYHDYAGDLGRVTIPLEGENGAIERLLREWPVMPPEHQPPVETEPTGEATGGEGG